MKNFIFRLVGLFKLEGHMTTTTFVSKEMKVLSALQEGRTLSSAQIKAHFGAGNPQAVI